jgi:alpha,alpha-trehalase
MISYGFTGVGETIRERWIENVERAYKETGKLSEKYNVIDVALNASGGEYPNQDGFGWTNGVYLKFKSL